MDLIYIILIGIAAGFLAGWLMKGRGFGWIINLILGIVGSFVGNWLFGVLGISLGAGIIGTLITATIGAVVLLLIVNLLKR
ncbi:MAG: GlsB/YeaQ/YmgE family stress response membrane protein [Bacteroidales bacterium]|jgi:uncharacterized membrane protein YeaQ/YmgE (transglycosylase-associated protein family)|nr:GlsB/YeaQ/YmgE family stress response membrane protein [Bacteroidales bacterium]